MNVVVDTNIVFSAILNSESGIGQIILHSNKLIHFYSPAFLKIEILNHFTKIKKLTNLPNDELIELLELLYTKIHFISEEFLLKEYLDQAEELTKDIDFDDAPFIALSIQLNCKLWTGDKSLMKSLTLKGFKRFITTADLQKKYKLI